MHSDLFCRYGSRSVEKGKQKALSRVELAQKMVLVWRAPLSDLACVCANCRKGIRHSPTEVIDER